MDEIFGIVTQSNIQVYCQAHEYILVYGRSEFSTLKDIEMKDEYQASELRNWNSSKISSFEIILSRYPVSLPPGT